MKKSYLIIGLTALLLTTASLYAKDSGCPKDMGQSGMMEQKGCQDMERMGGHGMGMDRQDGPRQMMGEEGMMIGEIKMLCDNRKMMDDLALTDDQKSRIKALATELEKTMIRQIADRELLMIDLKAEMDKDKIDLAKVQDFADKLTRNRGEALKQGMTTRAQILNLLTKEQRTKLDEMKCQHKDRMMKKFKQKMK